MSLLTFFQVRLSVSVFFSSRSSCFNDVICTNRSHLDLVIMRFYKRSKIAWSKMEFLINSPYNNFGPANKNTCSKHPSKADSMCKIHTQKVLLDDLFNLALVIQDDVSLGQKLLQNISKDHKKKKMLWVMHYRRWLKMKILHQLIGSWLTFFPGAYAIWSQDFSYQQSCDMP